MLFFQKKKKPKKTNKKSLRITVTARKVMSGLTKTHNVSLISMYWNCIAIDFASLVTVSIFVLGLCQILGCAPSSIVLFVITEYT